MKQSKAFHKGIRRVWSRLSAGSGTSRLALAFKIEQNFKGIKLIDKDHHLSQYADDTYVFMEASNENLDMSLKILEWTKNKLYQI